MRGVSYSRSDTGQDSIGMIAQEVMAILPQVVHEAAGDGMLSIAYGNMVGLIIEAMKQQQQQMVSLQQAVQAVEETLAKAGYVH